MMVTPLQDYKFLKKRLNKGGVVKARVHYVPSGSLTSHRFNQELKSCETGPTVFRCYPKRLESLAVDKTSIGSDRIGSDWQY